MGIATSGVDRSGFRNVYLPSSRTSMAHRSYLSPDGRQVLVVEMEAGRWVPCRLVPFDGSSAGRRVGPPDGGCTEAAWTPDGRWMYFTANPRGAYHVWRQRFPDGEPEQVTAGPTEENGIAMAPDGSSILTAAGLQRSALWLRKGEVESRLTSQGSASLSPEGPFSPDGTRLYFLSRSIAGSGTVPEIWVADLQSGQTQSVLRVPDISRYLVTPSGKAIVYTARTSAGGSQLWVASTERRFPPRQVASNAHRAVAAPDGTLWFTRSDPQGMVATWRIGIDGSRLERMLDGPGRLQAMSPDGEWVALNRLDEGSDDRWTMEIVNVKRREVRATVCARCYVRWSYDQQSIYMVFGTAGYARPEHGSTISLPLDPTTGLPPSTRDVLDSQAAALTVPGARIIGPMYAAVSPDGTTVAFTRDTGTRNLFRVPVQ